MNTELSTSEPKAIVRRGEFNIEDLFRFAMENDRGAETLERLMAVRRELNEEQAKRAFDEALTAFQAECPIIKKTKFGAKNAYKYAELDSIVEQVRPFILKHGFCFSVTSEIEAGWVKALCKITHRMGHSEISQFKVPVDARNVMMNDPQKYAGSLTFAKRYAFCNALGILTADEDIDAAKKRDLPPGPARATPKTREWFLTQIQDIKQQAHAYAIDMAWLMPDEPLDAWPLEHVPVTKQELAALRKRMAE